MTAPRALSVLTDLAHALESGEGAEARVQRALVTLGRLVPFDRCAVVNTLAGDAPRLLVEPLLPAPARRRLEARAEELLALLLDRAPGGPGALAPAAIAVGLHHLAVPLVGLDTLAGVILVERERDAYGEEELQLVSVVASLLGAYLAGLRRRDEERQAAQALRDELARRTHFLRVLSHELRNPLAPIGNALHVLERTELGSEHAQRARGVITRQFHHLVKLLDGLLDATRLASGKLRVERTRIDLAEVVHRTVEDHRSLFVHGRLGLELRVAEGPLWMDGDPTRLSQVVGNLLSNAVRFANPGGRTEVSLAREAPEVAVVRVRDDGVGIAPGIRGRLFEPFAQDDDAPDRGGGGLGLGLALAKRLVDLHGGTIDARNDDEGRGTEIVVRLPLLPRQDTAPVSGTPTSQPCSP